MYDLAYAHKVWPVPSRFTDARPHDWSRQGKIDYDVEWIAAKGWLSQFPRFLGTSVHTHLHGHGLALAGEPGVGKTMLACCFLNYLRAKGFSTAFVRDGDLMRLLRLSRPDEEEADLLGYLQRAACIVVDDLGRTPEAVSIVEPFLRYRQDEAKPTIVTMNIAVPLPPTLESFLHEFTFIPFAGVDRRKSPLEPHHARW